MDRSLKDVVLNNDLLYSLAAYIENFRYSIFNRKKISGKNNKINRSNKSIFRKVKFDIKGNDNIIKVGARSRLRNVIFEIEGNNNSIILDERITFMEAGYFLITGDNCCINIGSSTLFRNGKLFAGESNTFIKIGEYCFCGIVTISTSDFHSVIDLKTGNRINYADSITIGDNIWINNGVSIRKGALISNDSIIAPNTLVNKKFKVPNVILAGQPARVIKEGITWSREKL